MSRPQTDPVLISRARALLLNGMSMQAAARAVGIERTTLYRAGLRSGGGRA